MEDFSFEAIARKSVHGVVALTSRTFFIQILGIVASFILTVYLDQFSFGVFAIVSSIIIFFNYFQDIGLAASLIQKKEAPTLTDYRSVFTIQQIVVLALVVPAIAFSSQIVSIYDLAFEGQMLLIALLISFVTNSIRTVPTVMMERNLQYGKLVAPEIVEGIVYNLALIICAIMGLGVTSFTIAVLARAFGGLIATSIVQPWSIGFSLDKKSLKELLSFGVPFQLNNILALFKDQFLTLYIGLLLPISQLGIIAFAQKLAFLPLRLVMDNIIKITFPSFSRLQDDHQALKIAIEKSLFVISLFIFPVAVAIMLYTAHLIEYIPRYEKWQPAVVSVIFFALSTVLSSISTPLTNFLNAIGKVKITLYFMIFWTVATWILTWLFIQRMGYNGVAFVAFLVSLSSVAVFYVAQRYVKFSFLRPTYRPFIASVAMAAFILILDDLFIRSLVSLIIFGMISMGVYGIIIFLLARRELIATMRFARQSLMKQKT